MTIESVWFKRLNKILFSHAQNLCWLNLTDTNWHIQKYPYVFLSRYSVLQGIRLVVVFGTICEQMQQR